MRSPSRGNLLLFTHYVLLCRDGSKSLHWSLNWFPHTMQVVEETQLYNFAERSWKNSMEEMSLQLDFRVEYVLRKKWRRHRPSNLKPKDWREVRSIYTLLFWFSNIIAWYLLDIPAENNTFLRERANFTIPTEKSMEIEPVATLRPMKKQFL